MLLYLSIPNGCSGIVGYSYVSGGSVVGVAVICFYFYAFTPHAGNNNTLS